jgi:hypothetical protein
MRTHPSGSNAALHQHKAWHVHRAASLRIAGKVSNMMVSLLINALAGSGARHHLSRCW